MKSAEIPEILFYAKGRAIAPGQISKALVDFRDSYKVATRKITLKSKELDKDGEVFVACASLILKAFGMTRSGPFKVDRTRKLHLCWDAIGARLLQINHSVRETDFSRDRYLLEVGDPEREELIAEIWLITKRLLPLTMGKKSYGLVPASKILFSVLPEIVLPIDNAQWLGVFKTVDFGDVIRRMVCDIQKWEAMTGRQLNDLDCTGRLTTLPSVYNVMAMLARPKPDDTKENEM